MTFRTMKYEITPAGLRPRSLTGSRNIAINFDELSLSATQELFQTGPALIGLSATFNAMVSGVAGSAWKWKMTGPGQDKEVTRAISALFGRFTARWYLSKYHNARHFARIELSPIIISPPNCAFDFKITRSSGTRENLPDWLWCTPLVSIARNNCVGFAEAKSNFTSGRLPESLRKAQRQVAGVCVEAKLRIGTRWQTMVTKNWCIGSAWATEIPVKNYYKKSKLTVIDPDTGDTPWRENQAFIFRSAVAALELVQILEGVGYNNNVHISKILNNFGINRPPSIRNTLSAKLFKYKDGDLYYGLEFPNFNNGEYKILVFGIKDNYINAFVENDVEFLISDDISDRVFLIDYADSFSFLE